MEFNARYDTGTGVNFSVKFVAKGNQTAIKRAKTTIKRKFIKEYRELFYLEAKKVKLSSVEKVLTSNPKAILFEVEQIFP